MGKKYRSVWYRCLATLLMAVMLLGNPGFLQEAEAASSYNIGNATVTANFISHATAIKYNTNLSCKNLSVGSGKHYCCWAYAAAAYKAIWGVNFSRSTSNNYLRNIEAADRKLTAANLKKYFADAKPGAMLRIDNDPVPGNGDNNGHSLIYLQRGADGAFFWEGNYNSKGETRIKYYSWSSLASYNGYKYIKYIQWPGASAYAADYTTIDSTARIGISTKPASGEDQCYVKEKPLEDSDDKSDSVPKGQTVKIVGAVKNKYGNTWYKTADGGYVYSGDVTVWEYSTLFSVSANFYTVKNQNSHAAPYADSDKIDAYPTGTIFKVKSFVTNSYGNVWVELSDGSYMNFYDKGADIQNVNFVSHVSQPTISGETKPTGNINVTNQGFWLKGTVKAEVPFLTLSTRIIDRETGKDVEGRSPTTIKPGNVKSVAISKDNDSKDLDSLTKFTNLPKGWYQYQLNAQFGFTYSGKTFQFGGTHNFITSDFTVGNPGTLDVAPTPEVKGKLTIGNATKNGNILEIPVGIQGNPGLIGVSMEVTLPDEFSGFNIEAIDVGKNAVPYTEGVNGGKIVALMSMSTMTGDGNLFKLLLPLEKINLKEFTLKVKCASAGDVDGKEIMLSSVEKLIQLSSGRVPGDANEDGTVDWADVILSLKHTMKLNVSINTSNADVTADNTVNWNDVILLLKHVMKLNVQLK